MQEPEGRDLSALFVQHRALRAMLRHAEAGVTLKQLRTITIPEAAERLNVSYDLIRSWCIQGKVRYFQDTIRKTNSTKGGTYHIVEADLLRYVQTILKGQEPGDEAETSSPTVVAGSVAGVTSSGPISRADISDLLPPPSERRFATAGRR